MILPPLFALLAGGFVASLAFLRYRERQRAQMRAWREAVHQARLTEVSGGVDLFQMHLQGHLGHLRVRLETYRRGRYQRGTRIWIRGPGHAAGTLSVRREGLGTQLGKQLGAEEVEMGDPTFDRECFVEGPVPLVLAVLDRPTRRALSGILGGYLPVRGSETEVRAALEDGLLNVDLREYPFQPAGGRVAAVLPTLLDLAQRLVTPPDLAARLAENLRTEPEVGVRLQIAATLAREFPDHPATHAALVAACDDPSNEVQLRAATALGEEGRGTLLALVEQADADDSCRARAVAALGAGIDRPRLEATLRQARSSGAMLTACACLEALAGSAEGGSEALLIDALADPASAVGLAAARGLARIGTVAAVAPLLDREGASGELRSAARQAIAEIQARLEGASPGQLSLAAGEAGMLSLADAEPGRISLAESGRVAGQREEEKEGVRPRHNLGSAE